MKLSLHKVLDVDKEKCINCHRCIEVCPLKFCNDGSGDYVKINDDMCVACGKCIKVCTHQARVYIDDFVEFLAQVQAKTKIIVLVAPSIVSNFPSQYLKINAWLKSIGVDAIFDVSFGAELTVKSTLDYLESHPQQTLISNPCAAIVSYIQIYQPQLIPYLSPVDSPMVHMMKMIKNYYPQFENHKIALLSPCAAKKREYIETGLGDFNIAFQTLATYIEKNQIELDTFPNLEYFNPPAERAVLFPSPGGLMSTIERSINDISKKTRRIEGTDIIYNYLDKLGGMIDKKMSPALIDCLSCEFGCNAGPLTLNIEKSPDEIEYWIQKRSTEVQDHYKEQNNIDSTVEKFWKKDLYQRNYIDLSENNILNYPTNEETEIIYQQMNKSSEKHILNCASCGYFTCEKMAVAIFNGLNRPENCHHYLIEEAKKAHLAIEKQSIELQEQVENITTLNEEIRQSNEELHCLNEDITHKKEIIEKTHKDIRDSINYAKTIQESLLSSKEYIDTCLNDYFIVYQPKDTISGDFYYVNQLEDNLVFAVADCTGHGVPGGFITMLAITYLHQTVKQEGALHTDKILNTLRERIKKRFRRFGTKNNNGLDIALCTIDTKTNILHYSGANSPIIIIRDHELILYKANPNPIGFYIREKEFEVNHIKLEENDLIYLYSDGYQDQFGGENNTKLTRKRFRELLLQIHEMPLEQQQQILESQLKDWKNGQRQTDDITILAIKWTSKNKPTP